jgi:hypothetical protein
MYIDPNVGGMLFGVLAGVFTAITGILLIFSGKIRSGFARFRRFLRKEEAPADEEENNQA